MKTTQVTDGIFRLSANVDEILFESIWPIPNGVSMNSYIVKGEKAAIVDGVCDWDGVPETLYEQLDEMQIKIDDIDYVIMNHLEPDHSGWFDSFLKLRSDVTVVTSEKGADLVKYFYGYEGDIRSVKHGDTLDLGDGRVLMFAEIPNVHWPETIATYDTKSKTLLPCDAFGSFGAVTDKMYDDQLEEKDFAFYENEAERYYSNIVGPFSIFVQRAIDKLKDIEVKIIAPGHGIVWRQDPGRILNDYIRYASYSKGPAKTDVTVLWASMYGMSARGVDPVVEGLKSEGVNVHVHKIPETDWSFAIASVWQSSGVVICTPTYEYKMFPPMAALLEEIGRKKALNRKAFRFGSFGWSGGAQKELDEIMEKNRLKWEFLEPVEFRGAPTEEHLNLIRERGKELAVKVKEWVAAEAEA
ncbi:MAG: FprA family A-type flavoprotein [Spirochaetales bacterium]